MPWSNQNGGGPWGSGGGGGGGKGPWGGGGGHEPPDLEALLRRSQDRVKKYVPSGGSGKLVAVLAAVAIAAWAMLGFYKVEPDEQGIEILFGEWVGTTGPGLHWFPPMPIGDVEFPKVTQVNKIDIGYESIGATRGRPGSMRDKPQESLILTGDQNIVDIDFTVLWKIKDAGQYLFNIRNPDVTVKVAAESAMREVVGQVPFDWAVQGEGRSDIQNKTRVLLQNVLDSYESGIEVTGIQLQQSDPPTEVIDAFNDVQRARQDKERLQNEAQAYANSVIPEARGQAEQMIQEASAYRDRLVNESQGEAQRFLSVYEAYTLAPEVTRRRMYLETMGEIFGRANKIIIDPSAEGSGVVPYLPLPELQQRARQDGTTQ